MVSITFASATIGSFNKRHCYILWHFCFFGIVLHIVLFSLGDGHVLISFLSEICTPRICAKDVSLSLGMHWISNFIIGLYFLKTNSFFSIKMWLEIVLNLVDIMQKIHLE
jgi:hypothetical protein